MGYEVIYHYHERLPDGKYNMEEQKELKKKIGTPLEEISLDQLAMTIMAQLARRNIWVVDVEIFEFTKKKISFKESQDGGIVIKNKKFDVKGASSDLIVSETENEPNELVNIAKKPGGINLAVRPSQGNDRILTWMTYQVEPQQHADLVARGYKFTVGQKYPVHGFEQVSLGQRKIITKDDSGASRNILDDYFVPGNIRLVGDNEGEYVSDINLRAPAREPKLSYHSYGSAGGEMPTIRAMR